MSIGELLREVMTLTTNVGRLQSDIDRLDELVRNLAERVAKLENFDDLVVEKSKNSVVELVADMHGQMIERLVKVELAVTHLERRSSGTTEDDTKNVLSGPKSGNTPDAA